MPTNLLPDYYDLERRFRAAESTAEKIALLEEMMAVVPKHKGTDHLRADLRRKLSKLKQEAGARKGGARHGSSFHIAREGAGQVVVVGMPNTGKSSLVRALTNAEPEVSDAPFTTWEATPGMMPFEDIQVQLIDTPPLNPDFVEPGLFDLVRRADLTLVVVDVQADPLEQLDEAVALLEAHRLAPLHRQAHYLEEARLTFKPFLVVANKCDAEAHCEDFQIFCELLEEEWPLLPISVRTGRNLDLLKRRIFDALGIIRVYSKVPGRPPDLDAPFVIRAGSTVEELAGRVHRDFYENLKQARVWGSSEFDGQPVGRDYVLHDRDIVELRI